MESLKGKLLISGGGLFDPNFRHTVVLVGDHDRQGAAGVVLNRPSEVTVAEAVPPLAELVAPSEVLFEGGPVEPHQAVLLAEVDDARHLDIPVVGSVGFLTGEVSGNLRSSIRRARVFVGHAGWGPGQLEGELEEESWIVAEPTASDPFTDAPDLLWRRVLERLGPRYALLSRMPFDPSMN